jgi:hypothetical protein
MNKLPSTDLGAANVPARNERERRSELHRFSDKELKDELLDRDCTDFSRLQPWIRNALLIVIFAASVLTYWGMKCQDGELFGLVCTITK